MDSSESPCGALPTQVDELSLTLCDDPFIHALNNEYRQKDRPTDVLSFSMIEGEGAEFSRSVGDIVISVERALEQALEFGNSPEEELVRLLVHGILHLFGYEHENVSEAKQEEMFSLQERLISKYSSREHFFLEP